MMRPEWTALADNIAAAAEWLRNPDQPRGAMVSQFGFGEHCGGMLRLSVSATGWHGGPGGERGSRGACTFIVGNERHDPDEDEQPPFTQTEMDEIAALIESNGITIVDRWNGAGFHTGSFGCRTDVAHAVNRIHRRYLDGCPKPGHSVFCGSRATGGLVRDDDGTWWRRPDPFDDDAPRVPASEAEVEKVNCKWSDGFRTANPPAFVAVAWPESDRAAPEQSDDDRNLDAVRRALDKIGPLLVELGYHHATVNAGRRGHIDETVDGLRFVPDDGHGVCIPAEAAEALVALAIVGYEIEGDR